MPLSGTSSVKRPFESVFVREASCIPCCRRINTTSSPAAGLFVVLLITVPVIESASANPERVAVIAAAKAKRRREKLKKVTLKFTSNRRSFYALTILSPAPSNADLVLACAIRTTPDAHPPHLAPSARPSLKSPARLHPQAQPVAPHSPARDTSQPDTQS